MTIEFVPQVEEKLSPVERLEALCDPGSLTLLRSDVRSRRMGEKARAGGRWPPAACWMATVTLAERGRRVVGRRAPARRHARDRRHPSHRR